MVKVVNFSARHTWMFVLLICIIFIIIATFLLDKVGENKPTELRVASVGVPAIVKRGTDFLCTGVRQVVNDKQNLYVLYGNYGVVQAYDLNGNYLYTISLYNHQNGRFQIAAQNGFLYISDKLDNLYIFKAGEFQTFQERDLAKELRKSIDFNNNSTSYIVKSSSIWKVDSQNKENCIISRPFFLVLLQNQLGFFIRIGLIIVIGVILLVKKQ